MRACVRACVCVCAMFPCACSLLVLLLFWFLCLFNINTLHICCQHPCYSTLTLSASVIDMYFTRQCHSFHLFSRPMLFDIATPPSVVNIQVSFSTLPLFPAVVYIYVTRQRQCQCHSSHPPDNVTPPICCQHLCLLNIASPICCQQLCFSALSLFSYLVNIYVPRHCRSSHLCSTFTLLDIATLLSVVNIYFSGHFHSSHLLLTTMFLDIAPLPNCC